MQQLVFEFYYWKYTYISQNWVTITRFWDANDRKSQSGFCFILAGAIISWESKKQRVVATSTAESEYIALTEAAKEAMYLGYLLEELGYKSAEPITLWSDSQSAQHMAKFGSHHSRTKHIHYWYHFIGNAIEDNIMEVKCIPIAEMTADVLMKPLPAIQHNVGITAMGIPSKYCWGVVEINILYYVL